MSAEFRRKKLEQFFASDEAEKEFAQLMRDFIFQSSMLALKADENKITPDKTIISEGCIFLHELCEVLEDNELNANH